MRGRFAWRTRTRPFFLPALTNGGALQRSLSLSADVPPLALSFFRLCFGDGMTSPDDEEQRGHRNRDSTHCKSAMQTHSYPPRDPQATLPSHSLLTPHPRPPQTR